jgi:predicted O-methyltransferase YrrM
MTEHAITPGRAPATHAPARLRHAVLAVFTLSVFTSALLLFAVQPLTAKMALPRFGGSPAVWSVTVCFFQAALLAGYAYAHVLTRALSLKAAAGIHVGVLALAGLALPLGLGAGWPALEGAAPAAALGALLLVSVGAPFIAMAANAPLLQAWFARSCHAQAHDPYFLYAASNLGSFLALGAYPFVIEPLLSVRDQSLVWSAGYGVMVLLAAACAALVWTRGGARPVETRLASSADWPLRLRWMGLAFAPSALLVAATAHVSADVAAAPLLWTLPLALYLLTFVIAFARGRMPGIKPALALHVPLAVGLSLAAVTGLGGNWLVMLALNLAGVFVASLVCHGALARLRPAAGALTGFYLWIALGGALGGLAAAVIAPALLTAVAEYPVLLALTLLARPGLFRMPAGGLMRGAGLGLIAAAAIFAGIAALDPNAYLMAWIVALIAAYALLLRSRPAMALGLAAGLLAAAFASEADPRIVAAERSFYGVHTVTDSRSGRFRVLHHGTTIHGAERLDARREDGRPLPISYYHDATGFADVIAARRAREELEAVAVVGLGAGALACRAEAGERWRFFEIDPAVIRIASDPSLFSYLSSCPPAGGIAQGDARLTLADEPAGAYDLIVMDAFSSSAIPAHLLTAEAFALYERLLAEGGLIALHVSNRNMDLAPSVAATAAAAGLHARLGAHAAPPGAHMMGTRVIALAREPEDLAGLDGPEWRPLEPEPGARAWTDDWSNTLGAVWRMHGPGR